jgi:lysozyme-like protein
MNLGELFEVKKRSRKKAKSKFVLLFFLGIFFLILTMFYQQNELPLIKYDPFTSVKKYRPLIYNELAKYDLQTYTPVVLALMQQESHGKGGDPMQASESAGLPRNTINDPYKSIQLGVKHFHRVFTYGQQQKVDFSTIIQAYNMGIGYIDYVAKHGGKHSEALAKNFSLLQVHRQPSLYTCGGNRFNFRYPYCYGDFTYSTKVTHNIQSLAETTPVVENKKTAGGSF